MRIATWNVNSLAARLDKLWWWLERARPDVVLLQETKLGDESAPHAAFAERGYQLAHHGEGRWNGVAIASRCGLTEVATGFAGSVAPAATSPVGADEPVAALGSPAGDRSRSLAEDAAGAEARVISALCGGVRVVSLYGPNGRTLGSTFYQAKLAWFERLAGWLEGTRDPREPLVLGGDFNIAPADADVWDPAACHGGTHVSPPERAAFARLCRWGLVDAYRLRCAEPDRFTWWDYRAGMFHKNLGMRIDHLLVTAPLASRVIAAEIDREARKGKPTPSDHAPLLLDLDEPGQPIDAGWTAAAGRIAARRLPR